MLKIQEMSMITLFLAPYYNVTRSQNHEVGWAEKSSFWAVLFYLAEHTKLSFPLYQCNNGILIPVFININDYFSNYFLIMEFYDFG